MSRIRLYLDEDINPLLASALRQRGYDVISVHEMDRRAVSDRQHFEHATADHRAILTFNIRDFVPIACEAIQANHTLPGLVVSDQLPFGSLLRRSLRLMHAKAAEDIANTIVWLHDYRTP